MRLHHKLEERVREIVKEELDKRLRDMEEDRVSVGETIDAGDEDNEEVVEDAADDEE